MASPQATTKTEASKPEGKLKFERVSMPEIDGWYNPKEEKKLTGKLLGWKRIPGIDNDRVIVIAKLLEPAKAVRAGDEKVTLKAGQVIAITVSSDLEILLEYVDGRYAFELEFLGKKTMKSGRTILKFDVGMQEGARKNRSPVRTSELSGGDEGKDDEEAPF